MNRGMLRTLALSLVAFALLTPMSRGQNAELVLVADGKSEYQVVLPDAVPTPQIGESLAQAARLIQTAFKAGGADVVVVQEGKRDAAKPGIYLGDTALARANGVQLGELPGWGYVQRVVGRDLIIAGRDHSGPVLPGEEAARRPSWDRVGTAKGVVDFVRQYAGVRFLYPDLAHRSPIKDAAKIDLMASPAIEFLRMPRIAVPAGLDVRKVPALEYNTGYPPQGAFYDLALNRFPMVDTAFGCHTHQRAVPVAKYYDTHPEYFALVGKQRIKEVQYCISNPEVQELIYKDLVELIEKGYHTVDLGQSDGFRACQCENCKNLYDTGTDWGEKIWIFHRNVAERVLKSHPQAMVTIMSYIQTARPPKSFKAFPKNTKVMLTGTNPEDIEPWLDYDVPGGFTGYVYNWCPNLGTRYTPMRTPRFVEAQAKRLFKHRIQGIYRDSSGSLFGLEGPVYYVMGRMYDDPENNQAKELMQEFCGAAFGKSAPAMLRFYEQLYHGIELYSEYLGTRCSAWSYVNTHGGRRKYLSDTFQLLGFLYTPKLLQSMEKELALAERTANTDKAKMRLELVRREFDYLKALAKVVYLSQAFEMQPDRASRDRLLDAIDARNALIDSYYDGKRKSVAVPLSGWALTLFPPSGHSANHLRLAENRYQEPVKDTPLNWDTKAMRNAPLPGVKRLAVKAADGAVTLDAPQWEQAAAGSLGPVAPNAKVARKTSVRALYDNRALYVRLEGELPAAAMKAPAMARETDLPKQESLDVYLAPVEGREIFYRLIVGLHPESKYDAASGFIADVMDPRYGKDDSGWTGEWNYETRLDAEKNRWIALLTIPYKTLGVEAPAAGTMWKGNFGRLHLPKANQSERTMWSAGPATKDMDDRTAFGEIFFEAAGAPAAAVAAPAVHPVQAIREKLYKSGFEVPAEWKAIPAKSLLPLEGWRFRMDALEQGLREKWFDAGVDETAWAPMRVPAFWAETEVGNQQGYGWYRVTFQPPAAWKGQPVRFLFGGVDEQTWVYVNGRMVKAQTTEATQQSINQLWETPFTVDVPADALQYGAANVLAVRVHNSIGNGGIWRPVLCQVVEGK